MRVAGLLLAGGRSSRFGSEKAVALLGDGLLMDVPLAALRATCDALVVSARQGSGAEARAAALGAICLADAPHDPEGPLAGIRRGLLWAKAAGFGWLAIAPCDAPTLGADQYRTLIRAVERGAPAAVGQGEAGLEPLVSLWPVEAGLLALDAALSNGEHPAIRIVLAAIGAVPVALTGYDGRNVNAPADMPAHL